MSLHFDFGQQESMVLRLMSKYLLETEGPPSDFRNPYTHFRISSASSSALTYLYAKFVFNPLKIKRFELALAMHIAEPRFLSHFWREEECLM